jgi:hypothetical protein
MDIPHRLVMVGWYKPDDTIDQFSVHWQQDNEDGPLCNGSYFVPSYHGKHDHDSTTVQREFVRAVKAFAEKLTCRANNDQIQWYWMYEPPPKTSGQRSG